MSGGVLWCAVGSGGGWVCVVVVGGGGRRWGWWFGGVGGWWGCVVVGCCGGWEGCVRVLGGGVAAWAHYGSCAGRSSDHRENARRGGQATASALDVAAFRLEDGRRISVLEDWGDGGERGRFLEAAQAGACHYFGTTLGPNYHAAHANHFHLGMRGASFCR